MNNLQNIFVSIPLNLLNSLIEMLARNRGIDNFSHNQIQSAIENAAKFSNEAYQKAMMQNAQQFSVQEEAQENKDNNGE